MHSGEIRKAIQAGYRKAVVDRLEPHSVASKETVDAVMEHVTEIAEKSFRQRLSDIGFAANARLHAAPVPLTLIEETLRTRRENCLTPLIRGRPATIALTKAKVPRRLHKELTELFAAISATYYNKAALDFKTHLDPLIYRPAEARRSVARRRVAKGG